MEGAWVRSLVRELDPICMLQLRVHMPQLRSPHAATKTRRNQINNVKKKKWAYWASLVVQRLRLHASTVGGTGSIPGWGTKILHAAWCSQKKKNELIKQSLFVLGLIVELMKTPFWRQCIKPHCTFRVRRGFHKLCYQLYLALFPRWASSRKFIIPYFNSMIIMQILQYRWHLPFKEDNFVSCFGCLGNILFFNA